MEEETERIYRLINNYLINTSENDIVINSLDVFYYFALNVKKLLSDCFDKKEFDISYSKITKMKLLDKVDLIKRFYQKNDMIFDLDHCIKNGTIEFRYYDFFNIKNSDANKRINLTKGIVLQKNGKTNVTINDNGLVTDIPLTIHELSHFKNSPDTERSLINWLFNESLAVAEELICLDFLKSLGYHDEAKLWLRLRYSSLLKSAKQAIPSYQMFILFKKFGAISDINYRLYFKTIDGYNYLKKRIKEGIIHPIHKLSFYVLATYLGTYMYYEYHKDRSFIKNIENLHKRINDSDFFTCLKLINLHNLEKEDIKKLMKALSKMCNRLKNDTH